MLFHQFGNFLWKVNIKKKKFFFFYPERPTRTPSNSNNSRLIFERFLTIQFYQWIHHQKKNFFFFFFFSPSSVIESIILIITFTLFDPSFPFNCGKNWFIPGIISIILESGPIFMMLWSCSYMWRRVNFPLERSWKSWLKKKKKMGEKKNLIFIDR